MSRINFKVAEAAKNLEPDQAATRKQVEETHRLINQIIPRLSNGGPDCQPWIQRRVGVLENNLYFFLLKFLFPF